MTASSSLRSTFEHANWRGNAFAEWLIATRKAGWDVSRFPAGASAKQRVKWARTLGLRLGSVYQRISYRGTESGYRQLMMSMVLAAKAGVYVPVENIFCD
jgi:hypothetical protein